MDRVLVTGGSGFIAGHVVLALLAAGRPVRTTIRSLDREAQLRSRLVAAGMPADADLEVVAADLLDDAGWADAARGVDAVLHVASPVRIGPVASDDDVVVPAREGTLRVLRAARAAGVRRVVLTSAFHAAGFGQPGHAAPFTEADWTPLDGPGVDAYGRSKVLAERAAWQLVEEEGGIELVTLLPVAVMGPVLGDSVSGSNHLLQRLLSGGMPRAPRMFVPIVDVRDIAAAHVAAITADVAGQRILVATGEPAIELAEVASILRSALGADASRTPTGRIPDLVVRVMARFRPELRGIAAEVGFVKRIDVTRMRTLLGIDPRSQREAIVGAGESLVAKGLVDAT